jgi:alpha-tubulin suppressor-like RCC1 family protein
VGNNTTTATVASPVQVSLTAPTQVAVGAYHTCALRADGTVWCWGDNYEGQLGTGDNNARHIPTLVNIGHVQQIAVADYATCAREQNGTVWCWGGNSDGEIGDGTGTNWVTTYQVQGIPASATLWGGASDFCSVGTDNSVYCWGDNSSGQLGNGTSQDAFTPVRIGL